MTLGAVDVLQTRRSKTALSLLRLVLENSVEVNGTSRWSRECFRSTSFCSVAPHRSLHWRLCISLLSRPKHKAGRPVCSSPGPHTPEDTHSISPWWRPLTETPSRSTRSPLTSQTRCQWTHHFLSITLWTLMALPVEATPPSHLNTDAGPERPHRVALETHNQDSGNEIFTASGLINPTFPSWGGSWRSCRCARTLGQ